MRSYLEEVMIKATAGRAQIRSNDLLTRVASANVNDRPDIRSSDECMWSHNKVRTQASELTGHRSAQAAVWR